jgi:hypothetical protein
MAEKNKKFISLGIILFTALLCVAFFLIRVWHLNQLGQPINYLAELWAPSSVLSIVIVTFVEKMAGPGPQPKKRGLKNRPTKDKL